ncbi:MAG: TolC family outer membrane protein [Pseudomonadota bacterium]|nr:TolC family outer membrane protein [Pseudomonadota bacterium]
MAESRGLSDIYHLAVANDPALRAQIAVRDASGALGEQIRGTRGLSADATVSGKGTQNLKTDDDYRTGTLSLTLSMPLYDQGLDASIESQDAVVREADASLAAYRQSHIISVTDRYFAVLSAEQDLVATQAEVESFESQLEQASERLTVGIGTRVDVDQARARLDLSQVGLISAEVALDTAISDLEQLVDAPIINLSDLGEGFAADIHRSLDNHLEMSVDKHPDVVSEQESYQSALADLDEALAETIPTLSLSSTFSVSDTSGSDTAATNASARSNVLSLTVSAPIYTNGVASAKFDVAKANVVRAKANLAKARREVRGGMQKAFRNLGASARTVEARRLAIVSAASRVEATEAAYAVGSGDIVEVLNAKKDLFAAERDFAKARHTHVIRQLEFDQAIGDLSESSVARIDKYLVQ